MTTLLGPSWKTTTLGILSLLGAGVHVATVLIGGGSLTDLSATDMSVITAGVGLLFAKDHNTSNSPTPVPAKTVS